MHVMAVVSMRTVAAVMAAVMAVVPGGSRSYDECQGSSGDGEGELGHLKSPLGFRRCRLNGVRSGGIR